MAVVHHVSDNSSAGNLLLGLVMLLIVALIIIGGVYAFRALPWGGSGNSGEPNAGINISAEGNIPNPLATPASGGGQ